MIATRQLVALGIGRGGIAHRVALGRLHPCHRGVYAVGHIPSTPLARAAAALLACGEGAALLHMAEAALLGLVPTWPATLDVGGTRSGGHRGVRTHRVRLRPEDLTIREGLRVTTPARTLVDLAAVVPARKLTRIVNDARRAGSVTLHELRRQVDATRGRPTSALKPLLDSPTAPTRSTLEDDFLAFVRRHRLPMPEVNPEVEGHEVDALWREENLIVELDTRDYHEDPAAFERDRKRDAELTAAGFRVVRITGRRLGEEPGTEARRLRRLLERDGSG